MLLHKTNLMQQKANIVGGISFGRTESIRELTDAEANDLKEYLQEQDKQSDAANRMRRKVISMAHQLHWYKPNTQKVDVEHINNWCLQYGSTKKKLNDHTVLELVKLVTQFKEVFKDVLSNI